MDQHVIDQNLIGRGDWCLTYTGKKYYAADPRPEDLCIEDIARGLSTQYRFGGWTDRLYTVAQHCVLGAELIDDEHKFEFLMHDATEAYLGDMKRPVKRCLPDYMIMEHRLHEVIAHKWFLPKNISAVVKDMDNLLLCTEGKQLGPTHDSADPELVWWEAPNYSHQQLDIVIECWSPYMAQGRFLNLFNKLWQQHNVKVNLARTKRRLSLGLSEVS